MKESGDHLASEMEAAIRWLAQELPSAEILPKPTLLHSIRVGMSLYKERYAREICLGGVLHDALEDSRITKKQIEWNFGESVARLVCANTKDDTIREREQKYIEMMSRCVAESEGAAIIKAADILDNYTYYLQEGLLDRAHDMRRIGEMLLDRLPPKYSDKAFDRLGEAVRTTVILEGRRSTHSSEGKAA